MLLDTVLAPMKLPLQISSLHMELTDVENFVAHYMFILAFSVFHPPFYL